MVTWKVTGMVISMVTSVVSGVVTSVNGELLWWVRHTSECDEVTTHCCPAWSEFFARLTPGCFYLPLFLDTTLLFCQMAKISCALEKF